MKKLKNILQEKLKETAPALALSLAVIIIATVFASLTYQEKEIVKRGFWIEISKDGAVKKEVKILSLAEMMAIADVKKGEKIFKKCASCHNIAAGAGAKVGPNLYSVVNRKKASMAGFSYSNALKGKGGAWDRNSLNEFLTNPKEYAPGTKMAFAGLKKPQDRADVISYLESKK
jgi:cytochrome c